MDYPSLNQHAEIFEGSNGDQIFIVCTCPIGVDHDYPTWVTKIADSDARRRIQAVWDRREAEVRNPFSLRALHRQHQLSS